MRNIHLTVHFFLVRKLQKKHGTNEHQRQPWTWHTTTNQACPQPQPRTPNARTRMQETSTKCSGSNGESLAMHLTDVLMRVTYRLAYSLSMGRPNRPIIDWAFSDHYCKQQETKHKVEGIVAQYFKYLGVRGAEIYQVSIRWVLFCMRFGWWHWCSCIAPLCTAPETRGTMYMFVSTWTTDTVCMPWWRTTRGGLSRPCTFQSTSANGTRSSLLRRPNEL